MQDLRSCPLRDGHADSAAVLDLSLERLRVEANGEVFPALDGASRMRSCVRALGVAGGELIMADAVLHCAVEVVVERNAEFLRGA